MKTLDQALKSAEQLLQERGQLLNGHLLRLVDGDKDLFSEVRHRLIDSGMAEDRSGVGLAVIEPAQADAEILGNSERTQTSGIGVPSAERMHTAEWWLMKSGSTQGPLELAAICEMRRRGEINPGCVVRCGNQGLWQQPDEIAELAASKPPEIRAPNSFRIGARLLAERPRSPSSTLGSIQEMQTESASESNRSVTAIATPESAPVIDSLAPVENNPFEHPPADPVPQPTSNRYVPPAKLWSLDEQKRPGWITRTWHLMSDTVGGSTRLRMILIFAISVIAIRYWWLQPPSSRTIYDEFRTCRTSIMKLQDRRAKRSDWAPVVERYRPRIQGIVDRLKSRASNGYPLSQALYSAGSEGLLPLLENPMDPTFAERAYDQHMAKARELLDGPDHSKKKTGPAG